MSDDQPSSSISGLVRVSHLGGSRRGACAVPVEDGHAVTVGDELVGDPEPDAGGSTGDDGDAAHRSPLSGVNSRCRSVRPRRIQVGS